MTKDIVIFDASFFSRLRMVDDNCDLIEFFRDYFAGDCVVDKTQYKKGRCRHADPNCDFIHNLIEDKEIINFYLNYPGNIDVKKVFSVEEQTQKGDWVDVKLLALASKNGKAMVLSCDAEQPERMYPAIINEQKSFFAAILTTSKYQRFHLFK